MDGISNDPFIVEFVVAPTGVHGTAIPTRRQETGLSPVLGTSKSNVKMEPVTKQIVGKIVNYALFRGAVDIGYWTVYYCSSTKEETHRRSGRLLGHSRLLGSYRPRACMSRL